MADFQRLLERHSPTLVIHPQSPGYARPGAATAADGWADYHPCNVEFLLDRVTRRDRPPPYDYRGLLLLTGWRRREWRPPAADRIGPLRALLASVEPQETTSWELDVADIPSQDEGAAWRAYLRYLEGTPPGGEPFRCVTYARGVDQPGGRVLQYWYLYAYNDFVNNHEADWEMVTIALGPHDRPVTIGYSNHHGGLRLPWDEVPREGEHPLLSVGRGSHAGYFGYARGGHPLGGALGGGSMPAGFGWIGAARRLVNLIVRAAQHIPGMRLMRDHPPADPELDPDAPTAHHGVRLRPEVVVMPRAEDAVPDSAFWWLRYRGRWGSTRPRLTGSVGVAGPWASSALDLRWPDPLRWLDSCAVASRPRTVMTTGQELRR